MPKPASFEEQFNDYWSRERDRLAKGIAGQSGRPAFSQRPDEGLIVEAWDGRDPNVTMQHYAEIAQATVQELMADRDEMGRPRWSLDEIEQEVKLRQTLATYPRRKLTYASGLPDDDVEGQIKEARWVAGLVAKRKPAAMLNGWQTVDEDAVMGGMPSAPSEPMPSPTMGGMEQQQQVPDAGEEAY